MRSFVLFRRTRTLACGPWLRAVARDVCGVRMGRIIVCALHSFRCRNRPRRPLAPAAAHLATHAALSAHRLQVVVLLHGGDGRQGAQADGDSHAGVGLVGRQTVVLGVVHGQTRAAEVVQRHGGVQVALGLGL